MKKRSKKFYLLILILCSISLSGCGDGCSGSGGSGVDQATLEKAVLSECGNKGKGGCYGTQADLLGQGYSGGLCEGDAYLRWIEPTTGSPGAIYAEPMTETLCKNLSGKWYTVEVLTKKGPSQAADSALLNNACAANVSSNLTGLVAHIPIFTYNGSNYWADFKYNLNDSTVTISKTGEVSDLSPYSACTASKLSSDLKLHVPAIIFNGASYRVTLQYNGDYFVPIEGGKN